MSSLGLRGLRAMMLAAVAVPATLLVASAPASAQNADLGSVTVSAAKKPVAHKVVHHARVRRRRVVRRRVVQAPHVAARSAAPIIPVASDAVVGSNAPAGSAPALAVSQGSVTTARPVSIISDKVIRDVIPPGSDYNEATKYSPGANPSIQNGTIGDSTGGWRGFQDGQFNLTFDGVPIGDTNDFTHHSAAYFPSAFIGKIVIDRSPGEASQVGYATFGGTQALYSLPLAARGGGSVAFSVGNFNTQTTSIVAQSGWNQAHDARGLVALNYANTDGAQTYGFVRTFQGMIKLEKIFGQLKVTALATGGTESYNNTNAPTWDQWHQFGKNYAGLSSNPALNTYYGYNNSLKATDTEYLRFQTNISGFEVDDKLYTMAYWYPRLQNNGADQTAEDAETTPSIKVFKGLPQQATVNFNVGPNDVFGYKKNNNYRSFGNVLDLTRKIDAGTMSGTLKTGVWVEHVDNTRLQQQYDYTNGAYYSALVLNPQNYTTEQLNAAFYKLKMSDSVNNFQPFIQYEWHPTERLYITPGFKFESFTRHINAAVNQKTGLPLNFSETWTGNLPFLSARYMLTPNWSVYAMASEGMLAPNLNYFYVTNPSSSTIQPEKTKNFQIGTVYKDLETTAAFDVYDIEASNFPQKIGTGNNVYVVNGGNARYRGVELEVTRKLVDNLALYTSGALMSGKYTSGTNAGLRLGGVPDYTFVAGLIYDDKRFFASVLNRFVGPSWGSIQGQDQVAAANDPSGLLKVNAYNETDIAAGFRTDFLKRAGFGENAEFKIGVNNLFDHRSITDVQGDPGGATSPADPAISGAGGLQYNFQAARTYYASFKVAF